MLRARAEGGAMDFFRQLFLSAIFSLTVSATVESGLVG